VSTNSSSTLKPQLAAKAAMIVVNTRLRFKRFQAFLSTGFVVASFSFRSLPDSRIASSRCPLPTVAALTCMASAASHAPDVAFCPAALP
jgi:hypothetical protein